MFSNTLTALLALAAVSPVARAIVTPSEPSPGTVVNAGAPCKIVWLGDTEAATQAAWKTMNIQLMSGSNLGMNHITTVATNQDGSVNGEFTYTCPEVNPFSAIYFYQFTSPLTTNVTWTTRFTIASASGATTPPANPQQPLNPAAPDQPRDIPWGVGALVDPASAVAAPPAPGSGATGGGAASGGAAVPSASTPPTAPSGLATVRSTPVSSASASASSPAPTGAALATVVDLRVLSVFGLAAASYLW